MLVKLTPAASWTDISPFAPGLGNGGSSIAVSSSSALKQGGPWIGQPPQCRYHEQRGGSREHPGWFHELLRGESGASGLIPWTSQSRRSTASTWRLKRKWRRPLGRGKSWKCATRHSLKHTAFLQVETTLYVHHGSNDRVIIMVQMIW